MSDNNSHTLVALLAGLAIGAVIVILLSSEKGEELKEKLKDKLDEGKDQLKDKLEDLLELIGDKVTDTEKKADDFVEKVTSEGKQKTDEMITLLEAKLEALRSHASKI
ncbi:MAG: YtxH domain-containing protein [Bacteroidetes bacterium]|nr:YtxH domain-containing protein [Bacteroidota bacterium]